MSFQPKKVVVGAAIATLFLTGGATTAYSIHNLEKSVEDQKEIVRDQGKKLASQEDIIRNQHSKIQTLTDDSIQLKDALQKKDGTISDLEEKLKKKIAADKKKKEEEQKAKEAKAKQVAEEKKKAEAKPKQVASTIPSRGEQASDAYDEFYVSATGYTAYCNGCTGLTRWNEINLRANPNAKVIAVDPAVIPLGSKVWVEGYGYAVAADTGGAITNYKIDLFFPETETAMRWGRKEVKIRVFK